jgi:hypothetical protein
MFGKGEASLSRQTGGRPWQSARIGDVVNPMMRAAGILIPEGAGQRGLQAGFGQIEAQVLKPGMVAEAACALLMKRVIPPPLDNSSTC